MPRIESIDVRGLTRAFGGRPVLRGVTTRFAAGTTTFIEGPNGAGKSTLLAIVGTLMRPSSGSVEYGSLGDDLDRVRAELGWVSHEGRLYRDLTGRENVELAARLQGVDPRAAYERAAARVGVAEFGDQAVATLSRGQRQRVALARALVHEPSILLLDEPLTGLDTESSERIVKVLGEERERGTVVVVVSHVDGFPERVGGRRIRLERGRIVSDAEVTGG